MLLSNYMIFSVGVLFGALIDLYGCRTVSIFGVMLLVAGMFLTAFVNNIYMLFLTFGILSGMYIMYNINCLLHIYLLG